MVCLLALCFCTTALAQNYYLSVGFNHDKRLEVTDANCSDILSDGGSMSYVPETKTLTLNNFSADSYWGFYINSNDAVHAIHLIGNNSLVSEGGGSIYLEVLCGEKVTIYGDSPKDRLVCSHISMGRAWYDWTSEPPSYDAHLTIKDCTLKLYSDEKGLAGKDGKLSIENAYVTIKSDEEGIVGWRKLVLGDGMGVTKPFGATFSRKLGALTLDGKEAYKGGNITIMPNNGQFYQNSFVLYHKNGSVTGFSFSEKPVISYSGNELVVTTGSVTVQYPLDLLHKIAVEGQIESVTAIDEITVPDTEFSFSEEGTDVRGEKPGTPFYVFDMKGMKCAEGTIDAEGKANIRLSSLPSGIYIVKTLSTSFKIKR